MYISCDMHYVRYWFVREVYKTQRSAEVNTRRRSVCKAIPAPTFCENASKRGRPGEFVCSLTARLTRGPGEPLNGERAERVE